MPAVDRSRVVLGFFPCHVEKVSQGIETLLARHHGETAGHLRHIGRRLAGIQIRDTLLFT